MSQLISSHPLEEKVNVIKMVLFMDTCLFFRIWLNVVLFLKEMPFVDVKENSQFVLFLMLFSPMQWQTCQM